jgi:phosphoglucosamine mutase
MINVPVEGGFDAQSAILENGKFIEAYEAERTFLSDKGRVIVRSSGTEPLIRVIVEAQRKEIAYERAEKLANVIRNL